MDIITCLQSAKAPLSIAELRHFCGAMFSEERLEILRRSGEIKEIEGLPGCFFAPPILVRRRKGLPILNKQIDRTSLIREITDLREKLIATQTELTTLEEQRGSFPSEEDIKAHQKRLHVYNDMKDCGTIIIEQLASRNQVPVRDIYTEYNLPNTI